LFSILILTACKEVDAVKTLAEDISNDPPIAITKPTVPSIPTLPNTPTEPTDPPVVINELKLTCEEARFVKLINMYRAGNGLNELAVSESGVESTRWHGQDMISKNYFSHTEPNGRTFSERAKSFGYPAWAENIAAGHTSASETFCQWKNSSGHNTNMLRSIHRSMGIGNVNGNAMYRSYWSNSFGPEVNDTLSAPLSVDNCPLPNTLPSC
jgi:uncharacterized protein YkwD